MNTTDEDGFRHQKKTRGGGRGRGASRSLSSVNVASSLSSLPRTAATTDSKYGLSLSDEETRHLLSEVLRINPEKYRGKDRSTRWEEITTGCPKLKAIKYDHILDFLRFHPRGTTMDDLLEKFTRDPVKWRINRQLVHSHPPLDKHKIVKDGSPTLETIPSLPSKLPFIEIAQRFSFQDSSTIAAYCSAMIQSIEKHGLDSQYRFELRYSEGCWRLRASLDPVQWFDLLLKSGTTLDAIQCATDYMRYCEREHMYSGHVTRQKAGTSACKRDGKCDSYDCHHLHHLWKCQHFVKYTGVAGDGRKCGFPTYIEDLLANGKHWVLHRRYSEGTRDLLLMPKPEFVEEFKFPHSNKNMVQDALFWEVALAETAHLADLLKGNNAVERIVINFGRWESAERQDPNLSECHAHAHLWLTKGFINASIFGDALADSTGTPEDFLMRNARDLESSRLNAYRFSYLNERMDKLEKSIPTEVKHIAQQAVNQAVNRISIALSVAVVILVLCFFALFKFL